MKKHTTLFIHEDQLKRATDLIPALSTTELARLLPGKVGRATVLRLAIDRGLEALEKELSSDEIKDNDMQKL